VDYEAMQRAKWNKNYSKFNIDELLLEKKINLNEDIQKPDWVALYHYDN